MLEHRIKSNLIENQQFSFEIDQVAYSDTFTFPNMNEYLGLFDLSYYFFIARSRIILIQ